MKTLVCKSRDARKHVVRIKNGIVIYPADTIYGIGAYIYNANSNKRIFEIKKRDTSQPLIVLCDIDFVIANAYIDKTARKLLELGATVILKNKSIMPFYVSKNGKTAYRLAKDDYMSRILKKIPLTSTSVNVSTKPPLNSIKEIIKHYLGFVDVIISGKTNNIASTIVDFENKTILREGYNAEIIKSFLGVS